MISAEQILNLIFGGQVSIDGVLSICVAIYAVVISIVNIRVKISEIRKSQQLTTKDEQVEQLKEENRVMREAVGELGNIIVDAYLSNANVDTDTKRRLATHAEKLSSLKGISLSETTEQIIEKVNTYAPDSELIKHAEDIRADVAETEEVLDSVGEAAENALNRLNV